jgi:hypothetical protein
MAAQHSDPLSPQLQLSPSLQLLQQVERTDLEQRDALVRTIAARIASHPAIEERRHTKTTLRRLAWPVYVRGISALAVITVYYTRRRPREHTKEIFWFPTFALAREAFPLAQVLDDVTAVVPRLQAQA